MTGDKLYRAATTICKCYGTHPAVKLVRGLRVTSLVYYALTRSTAYLAPNVKWEEIIYYSPRICQHLDGSISSIL